jgi:hypothetical protein
MRKTTALERQQTNTDYNNLRFLRQLFDVPVACGFQSFPDWEKQEKGLHQSGKEHASDNTLDDNLPLQVSQSNILDL